MVKLADIIDFIDDELKISSFRDVGLNGVQLEGSAEVSTIAVAVDAGLSVVEKAVALKADLLLVHHGIFWGSPVPICGPKKTLIKSLLEHEISLVAIHLPLDAHSTLGNNAALAELLELSDLIGAVQYDGQEIGCLGANRQSLSLDNFRQRLSQLQGVDSNFLDLRFGPEIPDRVCIVSGSGADGLYQFEREGFDTFITGEPKQFAYHFCKENKLNAFFPGHYASETLGVQRLAEVLAKRFKITWHFIDEPTGI